MTTDASEYLQYIDGGDGEARAPVDMSQLNELADQQAEAEAEVARLEAKLNEAREKLKAICERQLPELMDLIGLEEFKSRSGLRIKIDETIRASIPKARTIEAMAWLKSQNHDALIKRSVAVEFGRGEDAKANDLCRRLVQDGFSPNDEAKVHPSTLSAFVREKLKAGEEVPLDLFGVFRQRTSKILT